MKNSMVGSFEIHEIGQSLHNYYLDQRKFEVILPKKAYLKKFGKQVVTKNLKTSKTDCHEDNLNNMMKAHKVSVENYSFYTIHRTLSNLQHFFE
mgnify:CR=1 FL=1